MAVQYMVQDYMQMLLHQDPPVVLYSQVQSIMLTSITIRESAHTTDTTHTTV
jgi:hypothetical protein